MNYCVTGGCGFIGGYFCRLLKSQGHHVTVIDLIPPPRGSAGASGDSSGSGSGGAGGMPHDRFVQGDIRDPQAMREALEGCQRLIHLAAAHHDFGIAHATYFSVNESGSQIVCDALDAAGARECVFYSTVAVYGTAPEPHHEHSPCEPDSPYGASKLAGEKVFEQWTKKGGGRQCLVIRPTVTFGPHNFANMYSLIRQIYRRKYVQVGPGVNIKSLSYVENIVAATMYLLGQPNRAAFDVYNFIDKPDLTSRQISQAIFDALDRPFPKLWMPLWAARLAALPFDAVIALTGKNLPISGARVKKLFNTQTKFEADRIAASGFTTDVSLREGIRRMVQWYVRQGKDQSAEWHQPPAEIVRRGAPAPAGTLRVPGAAQRIS